MSAITTGTAAPTGAGAGSTAALAIGRGRLLRYGVPHRILSGSLHYFRVHPEQWGDRLERLVDLGLNSVDTYVPWNFHQRTPTRSDFAGWRDVERFIGLAGVAGLDVIVRPGPYICAEWSNGGLPAWLTAAGMPLRGSDPAFLDAVTRWFDELIPRIAELQASRGGPVVAVQVENEFGSFGDDTDYLRSIERLLLDRGIEELLYTADGPTELMQQGGSLPGVLSTATLGSKPDQARALLAGRRPTEPFFVAEFWNGWFDHWGHPHHVRDAADAADTAARAIVDGGSISLYMAHGGTNFGLWAGANDVDGELRPTVTSYDSDAPIAEDGTLTAKAHALREVFGAASRPLISSPPRHLEPRTVPTAPLGALMPTLRAMAGAASSGVAPRSFEELSLDAGIVLHRAEVQLPEHAVALTLTEVADRARIFVDGIDAGTVTASGSVMLEGRGRRAVVEIVVENLGRVNYGWKLGAPKGLLGPVLVERRSIQGWTSAPVDLEVVGTAALPPRDVREEAGLDEAVFDLEEPADTFLALPGYGKGFVWVNGFLLGRYWDIGPQRTLYLPGPLLRRGRNRIRVLELHRAGAAIELRAEPELGPPEPYVEEF